MHLVVTALVGLLLLPVQAPRDSAAFQSDQCSACFASGAFGACSDHCAVVGCRGCPNPTSCLFPTTLPQGKTNSYTAYLLHCALVSRRGLDLLPPLFFFSLCSVASQRQPVCLLHLSLSSLPDIDWPASRASLLHCATAVATALLFVCIALCNS
jgi:hypothetical protein